MSDIRVQGFQASEIIDGLRAAFESFTDAERRARIQKANGIFELRITNDKKEEAVWTIDMKEEGTVYKGPAKSKPGVVLSMSDDTFSQLAAGKLDGQKAFMTGKLKTKGNAMLAMKLTPILETARGKAKL